MPTSLAVIPSRYDSVRLPGKPLALIGGVPMVARVWQATTASGLFDRVVVATDSDRVAAAVQEAGGEFVMTSSACQTGTDRVAEAATLLPETDVVVNVQGDQPFVILEMLEALLAPYVAGDSPEMATIATPLVDEQQFADRNVAKVVRNQSGDAIYFSRSPIPNGWTVGSAAALHHIGLYAYRRDFLLKFASLPQTPLEIAESLEQLRALEHGYRVHVRQVSTRAFEVNTPAELEEANRIAATM